jgi:hypothetical protein
MILHHFIMFLILFIQVALNESSQRFYIYIEYSNCNNFAFCEIFFQKFLRLLYFESDDEHSDLKKNMF